MISWPQSLYYYVIYIARVCCWQDQFYISVEQQQEIIWTPKVFGHRSLSVSVIYFKSRVSAYTSRYHTYRLCFPCCSVYISSSTELRRDHLILPGKVHIMRESSSRIYDGRERGFESLNVSQSLSLINTLRVAFVVAMVSVYSWLYVCAGWWKAIRWNE